MALNLQTIRKALADQIRGNIQRGTNVYPHRTVFVLPCITIEPADPYVAYFATMGPGGDSDIELDLGIHVTAGQLIDAENVVDAYLSIGSGNSSSIPDAIHKDRTLGGVVSSTVCLTAGKPQELTPGILTAVLRVAVITRKVGAL